MTRFIMRLMPERAIWLPEIREQIPHLEVVHDLTRSAMETFLRALSEAGDEPHVMLEDDIQLTSDFLAKIESVIVSHPENVIQFFSLRKTDLEKGSRWMSGRTFLMNQCIYLPAGYAAQIYSFYPVWPIRMKPLVLHGGTDTLVQHWLTVRREKYWLHVPSLVQHRVAKSMIDPRRSSKRQSVTFVP